MAEIMAFAALRFTEKAGTLSSLTCPPYDIISPAERDAYRDENPRNIIRLELPGQGDDAYRQAGKNLEDWLGQGYLATDGRPGLYIYEEQFSLGGSTMSVKGLTCLVRLEEWEKGVVLPHEETLSKAKTDRFNLMMATGCNFSSIYSLYFDPQGQVASYIDKASADNAMMDFASADGIRHRVWKLDDPQETAAVSALFADKKLYIADGHHRYETAVNYRNTLREKGVAVGPDHPANFVMMTLVAMEHPGLVVFPTHRIVRGLADFDSDCLITECSKYFEIYNSDISAAEALLEKHRTKGDKAFIFHCRRQTSLLVLKDPQVMAELLPDASSAYRQLDVNILHLLVLERILGIDKENMRNQKNLIYTRDPREATGAVADGSANCAFLINPTGLREIADVAGAGEKMPQKSTYFYPKLITGHLMNKIL